MEEQKTSYYGRVEKIMKTMGFKDLGRFASLKNDETRFKLLWQNQQVHKEISAYVDDPNQMEDMRKSDKRAKEHRERGNKKYKAGDVTGALECYNLAVLEAVGGESCEGKDYAVSGVSGFEQCAENETNKKTGSAMKKKHNTSEMSYCLANRSACLIYLQQKLQQPQEKNCRYTYAEAAIKDIQESIAFGYPDSLKYKLIERKLKCLKLMESEGKSMFPETLEEYFESLEVSELDASKRNELVEKMKNDPDYNQEQESTPTTPQTTDQSRMAKPINLTKVVYSSEKGNHVILKEDEPPLNQLETQTVFEKNSKEQETTSETKNFEKNLLGRSLKTGSVVLEDISFFRVLDEEYFHKRCFSCYKTIDLATQAVTSCLTCNKIVFCNQKCRSFGFETLNHLTECQVYPNLLASQTGCITRLAVSILTSVGVEGWLKISRGDVVDDDDDGEEMVTEQQIDGTSNNDTSKFREKIKSTIFKDADAINGLLSHSEDKPAMELLQYCLLSVYLVLLLNKKTTLFDECFKDGEREDAGKCLSLLGSKDTTTDTNLWKIGGLAAKILQIISCNGIELTESAIDTAKGTLYSCQPTKTGLCLFPKASYFNHSCFPDVEFIFDRDCVRVVTLKPVALGAELCVDYGSLFHLTPKQERQNQLKNQYFFTCKCQACVGNWPLKKDLSMKDAEVDEEFEQTKSECKVKKNNEDDVEEETENLALAKVMQDAGKRNVIGELGNLISGNLGSRTELPTDEKEFDKLMKKALVDLSKVNSKNNGNINDTNMQQSNTSNTCNTSDISICNRVMSIEEAIEKANRMHVTEPVLRALERYIDRNFSSHTIQQPSFNLIHAISTLKLCYRLGGIKK